MPKLTYEQQLTEELHALTEMIDVLTLEQIESVPKIREVFRYLHKRKVKCENAVKEFRYDPEVKFG